MPESLSLRFFGPPQVSVQGEPLPRLRSRKGLHLLALLALRNGAAVERDFLIGTLWPESDGPAGQESLRKTLGDLRAALGSEGERLSTPRRGTLQLDLSGEALCDTVAFDAAMTRWEKSGDLVQAEWAATLYRGPFLEGSTEDWVLRERQHREENAQAVLELLAHRALESGDTGRALALGRRAEKIDPLRESVQRLLYRALTEGGDYPAAQRAFRDFRVRLHETTSLSPDPQTLDLMQTLASTPRRLPPPFLAHSDVRTAPTTSAGLRHFPHFLTALHGRTREQTKLRELLQSAPLTTLVGMGGIGKTRLAVVAAQSWHQAFFVDLTPLPRTAQPEDILEALFRAVGVAGADALTRLQERVLESELLLVLDNGEPVLASLQRALALLLQPSQRARFLVTSREPLRLRGERVLRLEPLDPTEAQALFRERAEAVGVSLRAGESETIAAICQRLAGLPLAIELAAARAPLLSPLQLLERLADPLRLLSGADMDLPERQRSLRAVLEDSCTLLEPEERAGLEALSVFVGPFRLDDAEAVLDPGQESLDILEALHHASLLVARPTGWTFLQPVRDFASEKLTRTPGRERDARLRHAQYQARLAGKALRQIQQGIPGAERRLWECAEDRAAAFTWAESAGETELAAHLAWSHAYYLQDARRHHEAEVLLKRGLTLTQNPLLQQNLEEAAAWLQLDLGAIDRAQEWLTKATALAPPTSSLLHLTSLLAFFQGRNTEARAPLWTAFARALSQGNPLGGVQFLQSYVNRVRRSADPTLLESLADDLEGARLRIEEHRSKEPPRPTTLQALAFLHQLQGDQQNAVLLFEHAIQLYEDQSQPERVADARLQLARILFRTDQPEAAEAAILAAAQSHRSLGNEEAARQVLVNGLCFAKFARWFGQALRLRAALAPELELLDPTYRARTALFEGCVLMRQENPPEARACLLDAAARFRWLGDPQTETVLRRLAAWTYIDEGDLERAEAEARRLSGKESTLYLEENEQRGVFLAECLRRRGKQEEAFAVLTPLVTIPEARLSRGLCWLAQGIYPRAEREFQAICTLGETAVSIEWFAYASLGLAKLAQEQGQTSTAYAGYDSILARAQRAEDHVGMHLARTALESLSEKK